MVDGSVDDAVDDGVSASVNASVRVGGNRRINPVPLGSAPAPTPREAPSKFAVRTPTPHSQRLKNEECGVGF